MSLELRNVSYQYPKSSQQVLQAVNLRLEPSEIVGLRGDSGSGKSTLLNIAALLKTPTKGQVLISGQPVDATRTVPLATRINIGIVPQSPRAATDPRQLLGTVLAAPLAFAERSVRIRPARYRTQLSQLCSLVGLDHALLHRRASEVSDGQLQRILLARALSLNPRVLICDEPTAQLDVETTHIILMLLAKHANAGAAVLIASHDSSSLQTICSRVLDFPESFGPLALPRYDSSETGPLSTKTL